MGQEICERGRIYTLVRFSTQPCYTGIYSSQCTSFLPNPSEYYAQEHLIKISVNTWQYPKMYVKTSKIRLSMCKSISFLPKFSQCTSFLPSPPPSSKCEVYIPVLCYVSHGYTLFVHPKNPEFCVVYFTINGLSMCIFSWGVQILQNMHPCCLLESRLRKNKDIETKKS